jgi:DNA polymerase-3 subunit delta'
MQFSKVIGQQHIKDSMAEAVANGRISHAQLFLGPEGNGSLPLAIAYIQYLFCKNRTNNDSCGTCPQCQKITKLNHPDLHFVFPLALSKEVEKSSDVFPKWKDAFLKNNYMTLTDWMNVLDAENKQPVIGVGESKDILHQLSMTSYEGSYKVMIVWMAEKLNLVAANKILKILEEPPDKTIFILITESTQLPVTILSRTQITKIPRLTEQEIANALVARNAQSPETALSVARSAEGNFHYAQELLTENEDAQYFAKKFQEWMRICLKLDGDKLSEWIGSTDGGISTIGREKQKQFLAYSIQTIRQSLLLDKFAVNINASDEDFLRKFSPYVPFDSGTAIFEELNRAYHSIERNAHPKILFTSVSLRIHDVLAAARKAVTA